MMKLKAIDEKILQALVCLLMVVMIVDPDGSLFSIKIPLFGGAIGIWCLMVHARQRPWLPQWREIFALFIFIVMIPLFSMLSGLIQGSDGFGTLETPLIVHKALLTLVLYFLVKDYQMPWGRWLMGIGCAMAFLSLFCLGIFLFRPDRFVQTADWFLAKGIGGFGFRDYSGIKFLMIFFKSSVIGVFSMAFCLERLLNTKSKKIQSIYFLGIILNGAGLFLSGTRANFLAILAIIILVLFEWNLSRGNYKLALAGVGAAVALGVAAMLYISLDSGEASMEVKAGLVSTYTDFWRDNPGSLLYGQGMGASIYFDARGRSQFLSELTYLDMIRWFGLPLFLVQASIILYPLRWFRRVPWYFSAYLVFLLVAASNPYLLNSTGMLLVALAYSLGPRPPQVIALPNE